MKSNIHRDEAKILQINERHDRSDLGSPMKNTKDNEILNATRVKKTPANNRTEQTSPQQ